MHRYCRITSALRTILSALEGIVQTSLPSGINCGNLFQDSVVKAIAPFPASKMISEMWFHRILMWGRGEEGNSNFPSNGNFYVFLLFEHLKAVQNPGKHEHSEGVQPHSVISVILASRSQVSLH